MILSMTGFGKGIAETESRKIIVEIKSLNSKQIDLSVRIPSFFRELEALTRNEVSKVLKRGKVDLTVSMEVKGIDCPSTLNVPMLIEYKNQIESAAEELGVKTPEDWFAILMRMPETMTSFSRQFDEEESRAFLAAVGEALDRIVEFRITEGQKLYDFFVKKIENIGKLLEEIEPYEKSRVQKIRERLEDQLSKLSSIEYDKGRLEQELIFYIEKLDVTEEKIRLRSHLNYFLETMGMPGEPDSSEGNGKKLGFIAQEMGREINTLGSKANNADMQKIVVKMKDELEQIKEQVLNVL